jgi:hypothetical protein
MININVTFNDKCEIVSEHYIQKIPLISFVGYYAFNVSIVEYTKKERIAPFVNDIKIIANKRGWTVKYRFPYFSSINIED